MNDSWWYKPTRSRIDILVQRLETVPATNPERVSVNLLHGADDFAKAFKYAEDTIVEFFELSPGTITFANMLMAEVHMDCYIWAYFSCSKTARIPILSTVSAQDSLSDVRTPLTILIWHFTLSKRYNQRMQLYSMSWAYKALGLWIDQGVAKISFLEFLQDNPDLYHRIRLGAGKDYKSQLPSLGASAAAEDARFHIKAVPWGNIAMPHGEFWGRNLRSWGTIPAKETITVTTPAAFAKLSHMVKENDFDKMEDSVRNTLIAHQWIAKDTDGAWATRRVQLRQGGVVNRGSPWEKHWRS